MKKILVLLIIGIFAAMAISMDATAARKSSKSKISAETIQKMSDDIDFLTQKMYARGLFSPEDNSNLIGIKIKLDNQMLVTPDVSLAPLYYKAGVLYKARHMKPEAIDCFQTVLENFADTALAPKAIAQLNSLGVVIKAPTTTDDSEEE